MSVNMTVTISDTVYNRVIRLAHAQQQPLNQVVEHLLSYSLPEIDDESIAAVDESDQALSREIAAYHRLHPSLWQKYPNQHVALFQGEVVDHDEDGVTLSLRIYQRFPHDTVLVRQVEAAPERKLRIRSPRIIKDSTGI